MRAKWWLLFSPSNFFAHFSHVAGLLVPVLCGSQPLLVLSIVLFYDVYVVFFLVLPMLPDLCASGLRCLVPALAAQFVQSQQSLIVGSASAVTACPAPALSMQGVGSQSFVPSLLFLFVGISSAAFYHFGLLSHPILLLFLAWVYFFGVYSGLGLRCCGPPFFWVGSLSLVLVVLAWLLQLFRFVQVTWVSWTFCLGFFLSTSSVSLVVQSGLRLMFQFCPVSSLAVLLSRLIFVSSFFWLRPSKLLGVVLR